MVAEEQPVERNYPFTRIVHVITLSLSAVLVLVGIHILMQEENLKSELYLYWFISIYVILAMVTKMFIVVRSDQTAKNVIIGFLMEFLFFLPVALNDWQADRFEFAWAMLITNAIRTAYFAMAVMKDSQLV